MQRGFFTGSSSLRYEAGAARPFYKFTPVRRIFSAGLSRSNALPLLRAFVPGLSCVRRIHRSLENFYKIPSSTNFHFYEKKENIRGAFFSSCRKLFENYCRIFEDNRNLLLGHPVCIWRRIGKRKAMVREKERGRVRLGYVTGLLLRLYRDWGIERRLAGTRRHGNRWRSESESGEPAATDFHPRKNMGERVVITPTRRAMCTH